jgi:hypothetical protein
MDMNREAVNAALSLAGNLPLTDEDKTAGNSVYRLCKELYLPTLFTSLSEIDWRCARKYCELIETRRYVSKTAGQYYYEMPADCIRPLIVDNNETGFHNDSNFIITEKPVQQLYYVFHKRNLNKVSFVIADNAEDRDNSVYIERSDNEEAVNNPSIYFRREYTPEEIDDDFPEWEYTAYDSDVWQYFSYKMAARLVPRLRADDGAAGRAQSLEGLAAQIGEGAIQRSKGSAISPQGQFQSWAQKCGLASSFSGAGYPQAYYKGN